MVFPQQAMYACPKPSLGIRRKHIGQSSSNRGGCLNKASSCNCATLLSHCFLCFVRCFFLQAALQYITSLHLLHVLVTLVPSLPQLAHVLDDIDNWVKLEVYVLLFFVLC